MATCRALTWGCYNQGALRSQFTTYRSLWFKLFQNLIVSLVRLKTKWKSKGNWKSPRSSLSLHLFPILSTDFCWRFNFSRLVCTKKFDSYIFLWNFVPKISACLTFEGCTSQAQLYTQRKKLNSYLCYCGDKMRAPMFHLYDQRHMDLHAFGEQSWWECQHLPCIPL